MKTATGFFLLIVLLCGGLSTLPAHAQYPPIERLVIQQTDEALTFYSVDDMGTLRWIVSLPEVCINHGPLSTSCEWRIGDPLHIVVSPDGQYIAFTAEGIRQDVVSGWGTGATLFIYGVQWEGQFRQITVLDTTNVLWSPDSTALLVLPAGEGMDDPLSYAYLYDLTTYEITRVLPYKRPGDFEWLPDSERFLFTVPYVIMEDRQPRIFMGSRSNKTAAPIIFDLVPPVEDAYCRPGHLTWLPERPRQYYTFQCNRKDFWLYSIDLEAGEQRLEQDLSEIYRDCDEYCGIGPIYPDPMGEGVYVVATGRTSQEGNTWLLPEAGDFWRLVRVDQPDQWEIVAERQTYGGSDAAIAQNLSQFAIASGNYAEPYTLMVVDTRKGKISEWATGERVDVVQWLDEDRLLYTEALNYYDLSQTPTTWLLDTRTGEVSEFLPDLEGSVWVFPLNFTPAPPPSRLG
jgi:hypothetical protein